MSRKRLKRRDWLDLALAALSEDGPDALKLDAVCARAEVTRGSFYHHFKDHEAFLIAVGEHWLQRQTGAVIDGVDPVTLDADDRAAVNAQVMQIDFRLELAMRELGRRVPAVARIVSNADGRRLAFTAKVYEARFDLDPDSAMRAARLEYAAFLGSFMLDVEIASKDQTALGTLFEAMVVSHYGPSRHA